MKAVLMAGGEGSRLRPLTILRTKPMVPIVNKPVMEHVSISSSGTGSTRSSSPSRSRPTSSRTTSATARDLGMKIHYSVEEVPLGTGGSVKKAEHLLDEPFVVISGERSPT